MSHTVCSERRHKKLARLQINVFFCVVAQQAVRSSNCEFFYAIERESRDCSFPNISSIQRSVNVSGAHFNDTWVYTHIFLQHQFDCKCDWNLRNPVDLRRTRVEWSTIKIELYWIGARAPFWAVFEREAVAVLHAVQVWCVNHPKYYFMYLWGKCFIQM